MPTRPDLRSAAISFHDLTNDARAHHLLQLLGGVRLGVLSSLHDVFNALHYFVDARIIVLLSRHLLFIRERLARLGGEISCNIITVIL